jgi:hypothetical protein
MPHPRYNSPHRGTSEEKQGGVDVGAIDGGASPNIFASNSLKSLKTAK